MENNMIPLCVPKELQELTRIEEMLIAHAFPVISVYTKPGSQRAYKVHCINFSQDIQQLGDTLPRYPRELPVIVEIQFQKILLCVTKKFHLFYIG